MEELQQFNFRVYTIGHSNHPIEHFLHLLRENSVKAIADVRSYPYSRYSPQFDRELLKRMLAESCIKYVDLGRELGGRPEGNEFYDSKGRVFYSRVAATSIFQQGLARLERGIQNSTVAILCSEENPAICHRKLLIGRVLTEHGFRVEHIRGDGRIQSDSELAASVIVRGDRARVVLGLQTMLFKDDEVSTWKSIPSVLRKRQHNNSLAS